MEEVRLEEMVFWRVGRLDVGALLRFRAVVL